MGLGQVVTDQGSWEWRAKGLMKIAKRDRLHINLGSATKTCPRRSDGGAYDGAGITNGPEAGAHIGLCGLVHTLS